ncbi:F0F1 ATP synthase subunit delta [Spiroplasma clarkii]|uniref:ATP synthase subunit delta n=1 Tax=Spiroplasma clarkii TaxID=2139 RepID=A0A1Y0KZS0_9MOLU|nr:ATP synthase F1 subunit delta [Spiroplasma clarkii]ARU90959.1 F0F1 ATP synthase subunit delta [Spiroplasma clarkii]ATX70400.1 F0F1 ATP synthase subunit delta [Spiroplasma clarkii]
MIKESLIRNWSTAIATIAVEQNKIDEYLQTARDLKLVFKDNFILIDFLANHDIDFKAKEKILVNTFKGKIDQNLLHTLLLIVERNLVPATKQIFKQVEYDLLNAKSVAKGYIYSVAPLSQDIIQKIENKFSEKLGKQILLENVIKKELIAGIRVEVEGQKYDSSAQGKAIDLKRKILTNRK